MSPDTAALHSRLASVDTILVPIAHVQVACEAGRDDLSSLLASDPAEYLAQLSADAAANPILTAARALGAVDALPDGEPSLARARASTALGFALCWWGYYPEADRWLGDAVPMLESHGLAIEPLYVHWHRVLCQRAMRHTPDSARSLLAIAGNLEAGGQDAPAMMCRQTALSDLQSGAHTDERIRLSAETLAFFEAHEMRVHAGIGRVMQIFDHFSASTLKNIPPLLDAAEALFKEADAQALLAFTWMYRGIYHNHTREIEQGVHWLNTAIRQAQRLAHAYYEVRALLDLISLYYNQGNMMISQRLYEQARPLAEQVGISYVRASSEGNAGLIAFQRSNYAQAEHHFRLARRLFARDGYEPNSALMQINLGVVARRRGQFSESLRLLHIAREKLSPYSRHPFTAIAEYDIGKTYAAFAYLEPAIEHLQTSIEIAERANTPAVAAQSAMYLAQILAERGEFAEAYARLEQGRKWATAAGQLYDVALCERIRAGVLLREGNGAAALHAYQHSAEALAGLGRTEAAWEAQIGAAAAHLALSQPDQAAAALTQLNTAELPPILSWRYHALAAQIEAQQDHPTQAIELYLESLNRIRAARRSLGNEEEIGHFVLALQPVFEDAFELAAAHDEPRSALRIAELYGAQLLNTRLGRPHAEDNAALPDLPERLAAALSAQLGDNWTVLRTMWHRDNLWLFVLTPSGLSSHFIPLEGPVLRALMTCASPDDSWRRLIYLGDLADR